ncbi:MAG: acetaldehyde dehydrogenase (acetylating) [Desulfuromonadales bacterium GWD2_61_12]|nr:MAG: acetaldehyde dehydrogenase (acetylating) [Desulfuromonadales bacterium GWC2_61_20]OGR35386.1 MAG: acetaldehyde dehydrogenase (acetylating) [Desulfuromonadales bacterium GWD2_61_12]HAD03640.1 acetaldehyde dehydrogenase (acetylating) [Desulfuromonas sp.]HBT83918.1 acetaldehyde dehydrogenase (acetylating) [Desulfuromonas sp.]
MKKLKVAILGSGNIGTDLLYKVLRSSRLECSLFVGRNLSSKGMSRALSLGISVSDKGIQAIQDNPECCHIVFDCTSAMSHKIHSPILAGLGIIVIDLTPAKLGPFCIPAINLDACLGDVNVNMITCGGQASIPLAYVIGQTQQQVDYIEVVSTIASKSAGPATRLNLDEYIETTEKGVKMFSGCGKAKAILNLNPAEPCIDMQTTVYATVPKIDLPALKEGIAIMVEKIQRYVPSYNLIIPPTYENNRVIMSVRVKGMGDFLPSYAGNLDIINCAAIAVAEEFAMARIEGRQ